jgi:hypothetical protein
MIFEVRKRLQTVLAKNFHKMVSKSVPYMIFEVLKTLQIPLKITFGVGPKTISTPNQRWFAEHFQKLSRSESKTIPGLA